MLAPKPVAVPELAIVTPDGIVIVSPLVPNVNVVPVAGSTWFASNVFTVPSGVAGKYFFSASCQIEDTQADVQRFILEIQKNDSSWRQLAFRFTSNQDLMQVSHTVTAIDDASVGDAYKAKVYVETADSGSVIIENSSTSYSNNWFQGFKLL